MLSWKWFSSPDVMTAESRGVASLVFARDNKNIASVFRISSECQNDL